MDADTRKPDHRIVMRRIPWGTHADPWGSVLAPPDTAWCLDCKRSVRRIPRPGGGFEGRGHAEVIKEPATW